jgi:hypothetical protein
MTGVILQPCYIPWRGYFHLIHLADVFVFLDDVQYTSRDWRNRNMVKGVHGPLWLTVPVITKGRRGQLIKDVEIDNSTAWGENHLSTIRHCYAQAPHVDEYMKGMEEKYAQRWESLCDLDIDLTRSIAGLLDIDTQFVRSSALNADGAKTERLVDICTRVGITRYISGPSGRDYIDPEVFSRAGIDLVYHAYEYPEYPQPFGAFEPNVTIMDLLFNCGDQSSRFIWNQSVPASVNA